MPQATQASFDARAELDGPALEAALGNAGDNEASPLYLDALNRAKAHLVEYRLAA